MRTVSLRSSLPTFSTETCMLAPQYTTRRATRVADEIPSGGDLVRKERLELSRVTPLEPKSSASTSSATFARPVKLRSKERPRARGADYSETRRPDLSVAGRGRPDGIWLCCRRLQGTWAVPRDIRWV